MEQNESKQSKDRNDVILQIQKLHALKDSILKGNDDRQKGEAQNAMKLAYKLMLKHNITEAEIEKAKKVIEEKKEQKVVEWRTTNHYEWTWFESNLARVLAKAFRCYYYIDWAKEERYRAVFVGLESDAQFAAELFDFAQQVAMHMSEGYVWKLRKNLVPIAKKKSDQEKLRHDWLSGFVNGIEQKFKEQLKEDIKLLAKNKLLALPEGTKKILTSDEEGKPKYILIRDLRNFTPDQFLEDDDELWDNDEEVEVTDEVAQSTALVIVEPVKQYWEELSKGFTSHKMKASQRQRRYGNAAAYGAGQKAGKNIQRPTGLIK